MNIFNDFRQEVLTALEGLQATEPRLKGCEMLAVTLEAPRDPSHGDFSTNAAMVLSKQAGMKPREIADLLCGALRRDSRFEKVEVAGPGFINLRLTADFWRGALAAILADADQYGVSKIGAGIRVSIEYVSANPTGPMHVGHTRGAVFGDTLANLMEKAGYQVCREYYINDAGGQVDVLARSAYLRYREALGEDIGEIPEGLYPGDYLKPVGRAIAARDGGKWLSEPEEKRIEFFANFAVIEMMKLIKDDLRSLNIVHDTFFSERILHHNAESVKPIQDYFRDLGFDTDDYFSRRGDPDKSAVEAAVHALKQKDLIYNGVLEPPKGKLPDDWEPRPQTLFRATQFGDDVDRALKKSDGSSTYFASDIAYHHDKFRRGYSHMIDVFGADHGGYVKRMTAAVAALTGGKGVLDVKICQLVRLLRNGEQVKMSKRSGNFVTLREVVDEVGPDAVRFMMLYRKNDAPLDFDFAKVTEQSRDNPVFYVQYAHARICSVLRNAQDAFPGFLTETADLLLLRDETELSLIRLMAAWPRMVETAAQMHEPHRIAFYAHDLASAFHGLWNKGNDDPQLRFIVSGQKDVTLARLALIRAIKGVIASALAILGVAAQEEMR
ncbi:MAG: arginine--tRNA ligase [Alphaproteobacteria bacterium]|nr:arginine--tRNA ligase [Alphaproteobacteria bacterium]